MVLCVAGPMASGKNFASSILSEMGFACIDADAVAHDAIEAERDKVLETFSRAASEKNLSLLDSGGKISRRAVAALAFSDAALLRRHESYLYPRINSDIEEFIGRNLAEGRNVAVNAPLLHRIDAMKMMDFVLYVDAPLIVRMFRARRRDSLPFLQIARRFYFQRNLFAKFKNSNADTRRVWNTGSKNGLERKIRRVLEDFNRKTRAGRG